MDKKILQILENINEDLAKIDSNENLFSMELLDSIDIMQLVDELERQFEIEIQPDELELSNFESKEKIVNFIIKKITI